MKIFSFYSDVPELARFDELKLTILWRAHWSAQGWEPVILNEWHAQAHPLFAELDRVVSALPSTNPSRYERACWLRWLALAQVGGGWLADYDCFPRPERHWHSLTGQDANRLQILQTPCCPSLVHCSRTNAERFCRTVINETPVGLGNRPQGGRPHFSDQYALDDLLAEKADWIQVRDVVRMYSDTGWEQAPVIHFANACMAPAQRLPRWQHIPGLLQ